MSMTALVTAMKYQSGMILSGAIERVGFISMAGFVGIKAAAEKDVIQLAETVNSVWGLADYGLLATIMGAVALFIKSAMEARNQYYLAKINKIKLKELEEKE